MRMNSWGAALALGATVLVTGPASAQGMYAVTELVGFPQDQAYRVNLTSQGQLSFIQPLTGTLSYASQLWTAGLGVQTVGSTIPTTDSSYVVDSNEAGQELAVFTRGGTFSLSVRNVDGSPSDSVPRPADAVTGSNAMSAGGLGDRGQVVGSANLANLRNFSMPDGKVLQTGGYVSFYWTKDTGTVLIPSLPETIFYVPGPGSSGDPMYTNSKAYGVNDLGQVVGTDGANRKAVSNAYLWSQATGTQSLGRLPGYASATAYDINNLGLVVGTSTQLYKPATEWDGAHAFIWTQAGGMLDLNSLLSADDVARGVVALSAIDVNDRGDILTWIQGDGARRLALLSAVPEPGTVAFMGLGLIGIAMAARRRHSVAATA